MLTEEQWRRWRQHMCFLEMAEMSHRDTMKRLRRSRPKQVQFNNQPRHQMPKRR